MPELSKMPQQFMNFNQSGVSIDELIRPRHGYSQKDYPWAKKMLGKFPLPEWQRDSVWLVSQKISFINSVYRGYDLGSIVINGYVERENDTLIKFSDCLIDGQQRIETMLEYTNNKFKVHGCFWNEITTSDQRRFLSKELGKRMTHCFDEKILRDVYNHLNFSGTKHTDDERA
jgi:hypothetical protein